MTPPIFKKFGVLPRKKNLKKIPSSDQGWQLIIKVYRLILNMISQYRWLVYEVTGNFTVFSFTCFQNFIHYLKTIDFTLTSITNLKWYGRRLFSKCQLSTLSQSISVRVQTLGYILSLLSKIVPLKFKLTLKLMTLPKTAYCVETVIFYIGFFCVWIRMSNEFRIMASSI